MAEVIAGGETLRPHGQDCYRRLLAVVMDGRGPRRGGGDDPRGLGPPLWRRKAAELVQSLTADHWRGKANLRKPTNTQLTL